MIRRFVLGYFLTFFIMLSCKAGTEEISLDILQGNWLNKQYIVNLHKTRSPKKAVEGIYRTAFTINKKGDHYEWLTILNFHEGVRYDLTGLKQYSEANMYEILSHTEQWSMRESKNDRFIITDKEPVNEITWVFHDRKNEEQNITFVRVEPDMNEYVNRIVLARTYTDEKGRKFVFSESGIAEWPETFFKYKVALDCVLTKFDHFYLINYKDKKGIPVTYGFERYDNKLLIYNCHEYPERSGLIKHDKNPLFILTPFQQ